MLQHRINTSTCFTICVRGSCIHLHSVKTGTLTITCPINSKKLIFTTQHHSRTYIGSTRGRDSTNHEPAQSSRKYQSDKHHCSRKKLTWSCRWLASLVVELENFPLNSETHELGLVPAIELRQDYSNLHFDLNYSVLWRKTGANSSI